MCVCALPGCARARNDCGTRGLCKHSYRFPSEEKQALSRHLPEYVSGAARAQIGISKCTSSEPSWKFFAVTALHFHTEDNMVIDGYARSEDAQLPMLQCENSVVLEVLTKCALKVTGTSVALASYLNLFKQVLNSSR